MCWSGSTCHPIGIQTLNESLEDRALIERCQQRDPVAQKELFQKYSEVLYSVCRRYMRDDAEAQDVLQEGFVMIFNKISTFQFKGHVLNWMKTVVVHIALRKLKKKSRRDTVIGLDHAPEPASSETALDQLTAEEILKLVQKLPDGYRDVFNLYVIEGYKHQEIAKMLDIGESTSRSQLTKARKILRAQLSSLLSMTI